MVYVQAILGGPAIMKTCVIIPTYNESRAIGGIIKQVRGQGLEVTVIDDGSTDNTGAISEAAGARVLRNATNQGKGASLIKGFDYALKNGFDSVITMDGDGQHQPQDLPFFIRLGKYSNSGMLIGNRMLKAKNMPLVRLLTNKTMSWFISIVAGQSIPDSQCGFRLIKRQVLEKVKLGTTKYETESEIIIEASRQGFKIESIPIKSIYSGEKSKINPFIDTLRFIKLMARELLTMKR